MSEVRLTAAHHHLAVTVDESSLISIRHCRLEDTLFVTVAELDELVQRAPQIRAEAVAAWGRATGGAA